MRYERDGPRRIRKGAPSAGIRTPATPGPNRRRPSSCIRRRPWKAFYEPATRARAKPKKQCERRRRSTKQAEQPRNERRRRGFLGGRKKGVGAAGRQPGRPSADRHAIRNSRAPAAHAQDDPPTSGAHRGDDEVCLHPWSKRPSDGARRGPRERKSPTIGVSSARGRRAGCHGNPGAFIPNSSARSNPNPNPGHPELTLGFL